LPALITRQGEDVAVGVAEVEVVLLRAAEGEGGTVTLKLTVAHLLAAAEALGVCVTDAETRALERVPFAVGVELRQEDPDADGVLQPEGASEAELAEEALAFEEREASSGEGVSLAVARAESVPPVVALTDAVAFEEAVPRGLEVALAEARPVDDAEAVSELVSVLQPEADGEGVSEPESRAEAVAHGEGVALPVSLSVAEMDALPDAEGLGETLLEPAGDTVSEGEPHSLAEELGESVDAAVARGSTDTE
jgi:hypothetical protein